MNMSQGAGWKDLCGFLGKPIPSAPYPHGNCDKELANRHWIHAGDVKDIELPRLLDDDNGPESGLELRRRHLK